MLLEAFHDELLEHWRQRSSAVVKGRWGLGKMGCENSLRCRTTERRLTDEHFVSDDSNRIDVGAMVQMLVRRRLFRCHISRST